ncbi:hypothetical protein MY04_2201 [Flammeovirga sp. MY04]|uniref:hypothetical protein n=1 Tax=Flammeovirga sp. MY04 TaxID=1191459 RepID=UPI0008061C13|nr:hypothetical protein [Flammeovirga sp. MY04]ANQ49575.1 hypothetical protein MY04_2201 [Flammeovirga sp. MY04]
MKKNKLHKKQFFKNRCQKRLRIRIKRKNKVYNTSFIYKKQILKQNPQFKEIEAPKNLTLKYEEVIETLKFISNIKRIGNQGYFIDLKLQKVEKITEGAISLLLSIISDLERQGIFFKGEKPNSFSANKILECSGFFEHMDGSISKANKISKNKILKTGTKKTNQSELVPEIHSTMDTIWGMKARCPALYGGLGEMMRNTCDHAFYDDSSVIWHLGISHFEDENTCKYSFVDNGKGIIKTYQKKGIFKKFKDFFKDNADILKTAFENGIESRTGLSWRGKGLPTIFEMYKDRIITNFVVITNNVYLDFDRKIYKTLPINFSGTYYFWKIDEKCTPSYFKL